MPFDIVYYCVAGATVLVGDPLDVVVCHLVGAAIAGHHHTVDVRRCLMRMGESTSTMFFHLFSQQAFRRKIFF